MQPADAHTATTLKRAKASFKKNGPQLPTHEVRKYERGAILDRRAEELKEREKQRKRAREKREQKEMRDREGRRKIGIGLATQLAGFSHTQKAMKGAMEGFLGLGKKMERNKGKENENLEERSEVDEGHDTAGAVEEDMFDDDMLLEEFDMCQASALPHQYINSGGIYLSNRKVQGMEMEGIAQDEHKDILPLPESSTTFIHTNHDRNAFGVASSSKNCLAPPRQEAVLKEPTSPSELWEDLFASSTQICRELSQQKTPSKPVVNPTQTRIEELEPNSDDLFDSARKTNNPPLDVTDGVVALDFAYFRKSTQGDFVLGPREIPKATTSFGSLKRKRGYRFPNVIATPSPKMTSNCSSFTAAQCSFTSRYEEYGLSTQILNEAIEEDTEPDTDEEDYRPENMSTEKVSMAVPLDQDRVLMPPPPLRNSPKIFKPPSRDSLFEGKGGLQILGLSTQILRDAVSLEDDGSDTEEDEPGPSLPSPPSFLKRESSFSEKRESSGTKRSLFPQLQPSVFSRPLAKKPRLVSYGQPSDPQHHFNSPALKSRSFNRSFSAPHLQTPPPRLRDLHEFGFSTQIMHDFAEEDFELSPQDNQKGDSRDGQMLAIEGMPSATGGKELKPASSSFGMNDDLDTGFWDEATLEQGHMDKQDRVQRQDKNAAGQVAFDGDDDYGYD